MRVILVGHSHTEAIMAALGTPPDPAFKNVAACSFEQVYLRREPFHGPLRDAQSRLTDCGLSLCQRLATADAAVLFLEGGWHDFAMVERRRRFDFFGKPGEALTPISNHRPQKTYRHPVSKPPSSMVRKIRKWRLPN